MSSKLEMDIQSLQDYIRGLERELNLFRNQSRIDLFKNKMGLSPAQAWLLDALYGAAGRRLNNDYILDEMPGYATEDRGDQIIRAQVYRLRKSIGKDAIATMASGYRLSREGFASINQWLPEEDQSLTVQCKVCY